MRHHAEDVAGVLAGQVPAQLEGGGDVALVVGGEVVAVIVGKALQLRDRAGLLDGAAQVGGGDAGGGVQVGAEEFQGQGQASDILHQRAGFGVEAIEELLALFGGQDGQVKVRGAGEVAAAGGHQDVDVAGGREPGGEGDGFGEVVEHQEGGGAAGQGGPDGGELVGWGKRPSTSIS